MKCDRSRIDSKPDQFFFIDLLKAVSIIAVISFHSLFFASNTYSSSLSLIEILFSPLRFCVPMFFTVSFFLYETSEIKKPSKSIWQFLEKRYSRLLYPIVFWFGIGILLNLIKGNSLAEIFEEIVRGEIFTGSYYLLALIQLLPIFYLLRKTIIIKLNLLLLVIFHSLMTIIIYYSLKGVFFTNLIGLLRPMDRSLFIYWLIYLCLGTYMAHNLTKIQAISRSMPKIIKAFLLLLLSLLFIKDYRMLYQITGNAIAPFDYLPISVVLSIPVIFCYLSTVEENQIPAWLVKQVKIISKYTLGIFCINGVMRLVFLSIGSSVFAHSYFQFHEVLIFKLLGWLVLLFVSLFIAILLERLGFQKVVC